MFEIPKTFLRLLHLSSVHAVVSEQDPTHNYTIEYLTGCRWSPRTLGEDIPRLFPS